ncbi:MAG TPA: hypothetical protein VIT68_05115 [Candidatus Gracilibacteria bacterium]
MSEPKTQEKANSFLDQTQLEGRATGEVKVNLDQALNDMSKILSDDDLKSFGQKGDEWDPIRFAVYCHDCRAIVPAGVGRGYKGKTRTVCGSCNSRKISSGREDALRKFYNLGEREEEKEPENSPSREPQKTKASTEKSSPAPKNEKTSKR